MYSTINKNFIKYVDCREMEYNYTINCLIVTQMMQFAVAQNDKHILGENGK